MNKKHQILAKFPLYICIENFATAHLHILITFSLCKISSFRKKRQLNNKKYFHMNKTCQNDPGPPPSHLKQNIPNINKAYKYDSGILSIFQNYTNSYLDKNMKFQNHLVSDSSLIMINKVKKVNKKIIKCAK